MIVSVSGPVGSGKTTVADRAADMLRRAGHEATVVRFQSLPCFTWLRSSLKPEDTRSTAPSTSGHSESPTRWKGYKRSRLRLANALVYLARILAFRFYSLTWRRKDVVVTNRYFYDLFSHYRLQGSAERFYVWILHAVIPVPTLAILAQASEETLARRRPDYSSEYIAAMAASYMALPSWFPELRELRTDGPDSRDALERLLSGVR